MNVKAKILPMVIALSVLSAHALWANDDKKKSTPQPKASAAQQAPAKAAAAPSQASSNKAGTASAATRPQAGGKAATSGQQSRAVAGGARPQAGKTVAKGRTGPVQHAELVKRLNVRPSQQDRARAHDSYKVERAHYTRHMEAFRFAPEHRLILTRMHIVPGTYYYRRGVFYDTYGWVTPPYVYTMYPRYGLWDAGFLAFALHHVAEEQYSLMLYHHWADPEIQQWVRETNGLAATNPELRAQVAAMNDRVARLERSGTVRDSSYVPPDAQDVALSPDAVDKLTRQ
jgi:hypothetical protein